MKFILITSVCALFVGIGLMTPDPAEACKANPACKDGNCKGQCVTHPNVAVFNVPRGKRLVLFERNPKTMFNNGINSYVPKGNGGGWWGHGGWNGGRADMASYVGFLEELEPPKTVFATPLVVTKMDMKSDGTPYMVAQNKTWTMMEAAGDEADFKKLQMRVRSALRDREGRFYLRGTLARAEKFETFSDREGNQWLWIDPRFRAELLMQMQANTVEMARRVDEAKNRKEVADINKPAATDKKCPPKK